MACSQVLCSADMMVLRCRSGEAAGASGRQHCLAIPSRPVNFTGSRRAFSHAITAPRCSQMRVSASAQQPAPQQPLRQAAAHSARLLEASAPLWLLSASAAGAAEADFAAGSASTGSYYATLFLFVATLPGLWSLVKRAPKASVKRKVFEVDGPAREGAVPLNVRARSIFDYFNKYNYEVTDRGEVITFTGNYAASKGQAAALVSYVFFGLGSTALVLSFAAPFGGNLWYLITLISPAAGAYYLRKGDRQEQFKVKIVTADDEQTTEIITEGDIEETSRFCKELQMTEKGKEYVKGLLER